MFGIIAFYFMKSDVRQAIDKNVLNIGSMSIKSKFMSEFNMVW